MKRLLLCLFHILWIQAIWAGTPVLQQPGSGSSALKDTLTNNKPSADPLDQSMAAGQQALHASAVKKSKGEFKDLFVEKRSNNALNDDQSTEVELNPLAISFVEDYMDKHSRNLEKMKSWGRPYFDMIEEIFAQYQIPAELKYLAVIESNLNAGTVSWAGAVGPWQFIPSTARLMGLRVNGKVDERTNYVKSTHAAAKYIRQLYRELNDWLLVVAAYNCGPARVNSAVRRAGTDNFWKLQYHLPLESRNHVKKFIATHYIMEGKAGLTTLTRKETLAWQEANGLQAGDQGSVQGKLLPKVDNTRVQMVSGRYHSVVIAKVLQMDIQTFNSLNPGFDRQMSEGKQVSLTLPTDKMDLFNAHRYQILSESVQLMMQRAQSTTASNTTTATK